MKKGASPHRHDWTTPPTATEEQLIKARRNHNQKILGRGVCGRRFIGIPLLVFSRRIQAREDNIGIEVKSKIKFTLSEVVPKTETKKISFPLQCF
jgi:hypothetical protein